MQTAEGVRLCGSVTDALPTASSLVAGVMCMCIIVMCVHIC